MILIPPSKDEQDKIEAEHGPCVVITHPDNSCFMFKALTRETFDVREARARRRDLEADERMLQMVAVWPSREKWNAYVAQSAFEIVAYVKMYKEIFGGRDVRECFDVEIPADGNPDLKWLTNDAQTFGFRKPTRSEVKMFGAQVVARGDGAKIADPLETLLRACGSVEFAAWLDSNLFGIGAYGNAFVSAFGMQETSITPK